MRFIPSTESKEAKSCTRPIDDGKEKWLAAVEEAFECSGAISISILEHEVKVATTPENAMKYSLMCDRK